MYRYQVGVRNLENLGNLCQTFGGNHALFRLDTIDFEFTEEGVIMKRRIIKQAQYDWDYCGPEYEGTTDITPEDLQEEIIESGQWTKDTYNMKTNNCHDFMLFCVNYVSGKNLTKQFLCVKDSNYNPFKRA